MKIQNDTATLEKILTVSYKVKQHLLYNPAILLLGIYPRYMKMYYKFTQTPMHKCL